MEILQLIDSLNSGGAESVAINLSNALSKRGHQVSLCTTREGGPLLSNLSPAVDYLCLNKQTFFDIIAFHRLIRLLKDKEPQIIHAHSSSIIWALFAKLFIKKLKVVWHVHSGALPQKNHTYYFYKFLIKSMDGILVVNQSIFDWVVATLNVSIHRVWYLKNFIINSEVHPLTNLPGQDGFRVLCVASFRPQKDHISLIRAFKKVLEVESKAHLILVGEDTYVDIREKIFAEIADLVIQSNVTWLGRRDDVLGIMAGCDVGVLSSVSEGLPLVLLEYGTVGLPVVVTDVGECGYVIDHGKAGILIPPNSIEDLANGITELLTHPSQMKKYGKRLQERVENLFSSGKITDELELIYRTILSS